MKRPASHPTLPFDDPADDDDTPLAVTIRVAQPSLLASRAGLETDAVQAIEAGRWAPACDLIARLRPTATETQANDADAVLPALEALAATDDLGTEDLLAHFQDVAAGTATNPWRQHLAASLLVVALEREGASGLATHLTPDRLAHVYRVASTSARPGLGLATARSLLRDGLVLGLPVSIAALGDRELDGLEGSDLSPAWYPVLGALEHLWSVPKWSPAEDEVSAVLGAPIPDADDGRARLFWACYRVWKAQKQPTEVVARTRARMKQLHPTLFARLV